VPADLDGAADRDRIALDGAVHIGGPTDGDRIPVHRCAGRNLEIPNL
jgi:hypothetical protein